MCQEYWSARELFVTLEYIKWDKFLNVIAKAKESCKNADQEPSDHFPRVGKIDKSLQKGAKKKILGIYTFQDMLVIS